jgi:hypothetical protein
VIFLIGVFGFAFFFRHDNGLAPFCFRFLGGPWKIKRNFQTSANKTIFFSQKITRVKFKLNLLDIGANSIYKTETHLRWFFSSYLALGLSEFLPLEAGQDPGVVVSGQPK